MKPLFKPAMTKEEILNISKKISFIDLDILDEMVMELLEK